MKKIGIFATIVCAAMLCLAMVGCGGNSSNSSSSTDPAASFTGNYKMTQMSSESAGTVTSDDLTQLGLEYTLTINEDKTLKLVLGDETMEGTWEAKDSTNMTLNWTESTGKKDTGEANGVLNGNTLTLTDSTDSSMTFEKQQ